MLEKIKNFFSDIGKLDLFVIIVLSGGLSVFWHWHGMDRILCCLVIGILFYVAAPFLSNISNITNASRVRFGILAVATLLCGILISLFLPHNFIGLLVEWLAMWFVFNRGMIRFV